MAMTRDRLLTATNELFRRRGYTATSVKEISTAADATMGSLYHFFPGGKDQLAAESLRTSGQGYLQLFEAIADEATDIADAVTQFFDGAATHLESTDFIDLCPIGTVAREVASTNEPLRIATNEVFTSWIDAAMTRFVGAGISSAAAGDLSITFIATLEGGFMLARAARDGDRLRSAGRVMRQIVDAAIAARPSTSARVR